MVIPYGRQDVTAQDIKAVTEILNSDYLTQGPAVARFEQAIAQRVGAEFAIASNSATSSLHIACLALGVGPGDLAWTTPVTFVASINCARYCGAGIDFVDIDPKTYNISIPQLEAKLKVAEAEGTLPKVVIVVHLAGHPCDMAAVQALAQRYGFKVIEDASHCVGGRYRNTSIGSCHHSDITVFSFHPVKIITTGEGGVALTNDANLAERMRLFNSHGVTREPSLLSKEPDGPWYYEQLELGYNYRMTDIHAALGLSQLDRLDQYSAKRHELAHRYDELLADLPLVTPWRDSRDYSGFHLYIIRLKLDECAVSHREAFEKLRAAGILVNLHYIPVYRQPDFSQFGFNPTDYPEAEKYYSEAMSIPLYPLLTQDKQDEVVGAIARIISPAQ